MQTLVLIAISQLVKVKNILKYQLHYFIVLPWTKTWLFISHSLYQGTLHCIWHVWLQLTQYFLRRSKNCGKFSRQINDGQFITSLSSFEVTAQVNLHKALSTCNCYCAKTMKKTQTYPPPPYIYIHIFCNVPLTQLSYSSSKDEYCYDERLLDIVKLDSCQMDRGMLLMLLVLCLRFVSRSVSRRFISAYNQRQNSEEK